MPEPTGALHALRASTQDLVQGLALEHWTDADVRAPSLCEGWTRAHVLTHIARNADGIARTLAGALRGEIVPRYPDDRDAAIEAGSARPVAELLADVAESASRLDVVLAAVTDAEAWAAPTANDHPAGAWPHRRLREVEIHRVDLAGTYTPDRWPPLLITEVLPVFIDSLAGRIEGAVRVSVSGEGSVVPDLVGQEWTAGDGTPVEVSGPDWAILAWLLGRDTVAKGALTATPPLRPSGY